MIRRIIAATGVELLKLFRRKFLPVALMGTLILCLAVIYSHHRCAAVYEHHRLAAANEPDKSSPAYQQHVRAAEKEYTNGYMSFASAMRIGVYVSLILIIIYSSLAVSQESTLSTLKTVLIRPIRRGEFYAGKLLSTVLLSLILILPTYALSYFASAGLVGMGDVLDKEYPTADPIFSKEEMTGYLMNGMLLMGLSLVAYAVLGLFISCCSENAGFAVGIGFAAFLGLELLADPSLRVPLIEEIMPASNTALLSLNYFIGGPLETISKAANGFSDFAFKLHVPGIVLVGILVAIAYMLIFGFLGLVIFSRKDILN